MTAISSIISLPCIAVSTDSLLTVYNSRKKINEIIETRKPKIIRIEKLQASFSYWGLAAKSKYSNWTTYKWLCEIAKKGKDYNSLSDYAQFVKTELDKTITNLGIPKKSSGIGIHLIGYENINGYKIPELFLISNFTDPSYRKVSNLGVSRHLYGTLPEDFRSNYTATTIEEKQMVVKEFLEKGRLFIFNNGDPEMFNPLFNGFKEVMNLSKKRKCFRNSKDIEIYRALAKRPIEMISKTQKDFYKSGKILVGGRIHDLVIEKNNGKFTSTSGV